jgi:hypothetical protein
MPIAGESHSGSFLLTWASPIFLEQEECSTSHPTALPFLQTSDKTDSHGVAGSLRDSLFLLFWYNVTKLFQWEKFLVLVFLVVLGSHARQVLYCLSCSVIPVLCWVFLRQGLTNYLPRLVSVLILLISASWVARIIGMSHQCSALMGKDLTLYKSWKVIYPRKVGSFPKLVHQL